MANLKSTNMTYTYFSNEEFFFLDGKKKLGESIPPGKNCKGSCSRRKK